MMMKINYSALVLTLAHYKSTQVVFSPEYCIKFTACISYFFLFHYVFNAKSLIKARYQILESACCSIQREPGNV